MIKHVIFDLDGTLSDSALLTIAALDEVAPRYGLKPPEREAIRRTIGYANPEFYHRLYTNGPVWLIEQMGDDVEEKEAALLPAFGDRLLFPGCLDLLNALKSRGICMYIASTGDERHVCSVLRATGIEHFFCAAHYGEPSKIAMLGRLITAPKDEWIMVGDMGKDAEGAIANGILCVGACYGYCVRGKDPFSEYVEAPMDLLSIIFNA
jgi:phosphoglycolate phosphatase